MSTTYTKNGHIHGHYNPVRGGMFDQLGKDLACSFWEQHGWTSHTHDRNENNELLWQNTDLRMTINGTFLNIEAAVKRDNLWKFIRSGVDVETRKLKYVKEGERAFVAMADYRMDYGKAVGGDNMLLIPMECLVAAQRDCGDQYQGMGDIRPSSGFQMPEHGCVRVRKRCRSGYGQTGEAEDFYRVPYEYVAHYRRDASGRYVKIKSPERKLINGRP